MCLRVDFDTSDFFIFFFNDTATTEIYTLSLHDALPICRGGDARARRAVGAGDARHLVGAGRERAGRERDGLVRVGDSSAAAAQTARAGAGARLTASVPSHPSSVVRDDVGLCST